MKTTINLRDLTQTELDGLREHFSIEARAGLRAGAGRLFASYLGGDTTLYVYSYTIDPSNPDTWEIGDDGIVTTRRSDLERFFADIASDLIADGDERHIAAMKEELFQEYCLKNAITPA